MVHERSFRRWELALLLGLALALTTAAWCAGESADLAGQVVRLHVVGASDSAEDQAMKLRVRDAVLAHAAPLLEGAEDREEALDILAAHLEELAWAGAEVSGTAVTAAVEEDVWFPTKHYANFSLPAGRYTALKVTVGEGEGRNWWCVVYPSLCLGAVSEETVAEAGAFSEGQVALLTGESEGYAVKFRLLELWGELQKKG